MQAQCKVLHNATSSTEDYHGHWGDTDRALLQPGIDVNAISVVRGAAEVDADLNPKQTHRATYICLEQER